MRYRAFLSITLIALLTVDCNPSKKSVAAPAPVVSGTESSVPAGPPKSTTGIYAPGEAELVAIRVQFKDVEMKTLTQGYSLYTGVCTDCHKAFSIYNIPESNWPSVINDMAMRARLSDTEKDAVIKYVFSIKGTQPK